MVPRPKILIIGDSISLGYAPHVADMLAGEFDVVHNEGNAGDSGQLLAALDGYLAAASAVVVHFNCGLHDIKRLKAGADQCNIPLPDYKANLARIVQRLDRIGMRLIWAASTPVIDSRHAARKDFSFHRRQSDVEAYNGAAMEIIRPAGIKINDLHERTVAGGTEKLIGPDGVHLTDEGYRLLAAAVAHAIRQLPGR
ncbi:MAG: hypothetical protein HZA50_03555 [Planctomycetes bacterium]|nr:hypothetical protein [Planctomycetota bacterium]